MVLYAKYRAIMLPLLRRRSDVGIDDLVVLLDVVVFQHCDGCGGTGEPDWLARLGTEESFWRWWAPS